MEPSAAAGFGHLFSWRHPATMDLSHAAYRYNQNMMEYYTCKSKFHAITYYKIVLAEFSLNIRKCMVIGYPRGS